MKTQVNYNFYADHKQITIKLPDAINVGEQRYMAIDNYCYSLENHLSTIRKLVEEAKQEGVVDLYISFHHQDDNPHIKLNGGIPWSEDKINKFIKAEEEMKNSEKGQDLEQLKLLINKYPEETKELLK